MNNKDSIKETIKYIFQELLKEYGDSEFARYDSIPKDFWGDKGAGILVYSIKTKRFLVSLRSKHVYEPLTYGVVGGRIEPEDKDIKKAALREFEEETGYSGPIKLIPLYIFKRNGFEYYNFLGIIQDEFNAEPDWETESFEWLTFDEVMNLNPKHFGFKELLKNSGDKIKKYTSTL